MKRRGIALVLCFMLFFTNIVMASDMSSWAVDEVTTSIEYQLVPEFLQKDYQANIKRFEYVVLANRILDLLNRHVTIEIKYPFYDIEGHPYEEDMVKAFNAGIIEGDGRGSFRPDDEITREEVASLLCNLIKAIDSTADWTHTLKGDYSDESQIADWAMNYINYLYTRNILQGNGKDSNGKDKIDPKGSATREQSIILLLRIAFEYELIWTEDIGTIPILTVSQNMDDRVELINNKPYLVTDVINDFATYSGVDMASKVLELSSRDQVDVTAMDESYYRLKVEELGLIEYASTPHQIEITMNANEAAKSLITDIYLELLEIHMTSELVDIMIDRTLSDYGEASEYNFSEPLTEGVMLAIEYNQTLGYYYYVITIDNEL